jgi:hypothetical protein
LERGESYSHCGAFAPTQISNMVGCSDADQ